MYEIAVGTSIAEPGRRLRTPSVRDRSHKELKRACEEKPGLIPGSQGLV